MQWFSDSLVVWLHCVFKLQWNEEEVYRFLMKWYGGEPGSGNPHDAAAAAAAGGSAAAAAAAAAALTAADEDVSSADADASSSSFGSGVMLGDVIDMLGVVAAVGFCYWLFRRSQRHRRGLLAGGKALHKGHHHHHIGVHAHHVSNGEGWAGRGYAQKRDMN
jgi:hypothetical protein